MNNRKIIYLDDAIDAIKSEQAYYAPEDGPELFFEYNHAMKALEKLPSAQQWIPCSERLPHMWDEKYLVSLAWGGVGVMEFKSTGFHNYGSFSPVPIESVIAWMPLPKPYKERREE